MNTPFDLFREKLEYLVQSFAYNEVLNPDNIYGDSVDESVVISRVELADFYGDLQDYFKSKSAEAAKKDNLTLASSLLKTAIAFGNASCDLLSQANGLADSVIKRKGDEKL